MEPQAGNTERMLLPSVCPGPAAITGHQSSFGATTSHGEPGRCCWKRWIPGKLLPPLQSLSLGASASFHEGWTMPSDGDRQMEKLHMEEGRRKEWESRGKQIILRRQKKTNRGHQRKPKRTCSELSPSSARPDLIFPGIQRLVFQKKAGSEFYSGGFCVAWAQQQPPVTGTWSIWKARVEFCRDTPPSPAGGTARWTKSPLTNQSQDSWPASFLGRN